MGEKGSETEKVEEKMRCMYPTGPGYEKIGPRLQILYIDGFLPLNGNCFGCKLVVTPGPDLR